MKNKRLFFDVVFFAVALGEIFSRITYNDTLHYILKPLLLPWLWFYFYSFVKDNFTLFVQYILSAFLLSFLGDIALIFEDESEFFFLIGLASFLFAHIFYICAFLNSAHGNWYLKKNWFLIIPFIGVGAVTSIIMYPNMDSMLAFPVIFYTGVLLLMVLSALNRKNAVSRKSFWLVFTGAVLFLISDATLSANKFMLDIAWGDAVVMFTYVWAQYFIMRGSMEQIINEKDITFC